MRCCTRRKAPRVDVSFFGIATEADGGEQVTGLHKKFDFDVSGVIGAGWRKSKSCAPPGFFLVGGDAIVIERQEQSEGEDQWQRRVLLALPELAVDIKRARWLSRRAGFSMEAAVLCHLRRAIELRPHGRIVLEFSYPAGEPLDTFLQRNGPLSSQCAQILCRDLLNLVNFSASAPGGPSPLRLCSFIDVSNVFVNEKGRLQSLIPLGSILTWAGACAASTSLKQDRNDKFLAPELKIAMENDVKAYLTDSAAAFEKSFAADGFAAAMLTARALGRDQEDPTSAGELPSLALDFLRKVLHGQSEYRLCGPDALRHPWMRDAPRSDIA